MAKALSITVHPAPLSGEYLTVADALRQVLDIVEALEHAETGEGGPRQITWRLTKAHTNSPPFTVVAEPYPVQPEISIALEANRIVTNFASDIRNLLNGIVPEGFAAEVGRPMRRAFARNLNGIGKTDIQVEGDDAIAVVPQTARAAMNALELLDIEKEASRVDWSRTEYGSVEGKVVGLSRWNDRPAIVITERLSGEKFTGVLSAELAEKVGAAHTWLEAWAERRVLVTGALHFNADSILKRADLIELEGLEWTDVPLTEAQKVDLLSGRSVSEHLAAMRGEGRG